VCSVLSCRDPPFAPGIQAARATHRLPCDRSFEAHEFDRHGASFQKLRLVARAETDGTRSEFLHTLRFWGSTRARASGRCSSQRHPRAIERYRRSSRQPPARVSPSSWQATSVGVRAGRVRDHEALGTPFHVEEELSHHQEVAELEEDQGQQSVPGRCSPLVALLEPRDQTRTAALERDELPRGWIAMNHAIHLPNHVRRLVLLGPMGLSPWRANLAVLVPFAWYALRPTEAKFERIIFRALGEGERVNREFRPWMLIMGKCKPKTGQPFRLSSRKLQLIKAPTLVILGGKDGLVGSATAAAKRARNIPNCELEILLQAGHIMSVDEPEFVAERIVKFLEAEND